MESNYDKWKNIINMFDVDDDKKIKLADYADHHAKIEMENQTFDIETSLLPISLKILSKMDNFEITKDPLMVEDHTVSIVLPKDEIISIKKSMKIDVMPHVENVLAYEIINKYKNKKLLVYLMVKSIQLITEKDNVFPPTMTLNSRIKILES